MTIIISTQTGEKVFDKDMINVGTNQNWDVVLNLNYDIMLTLQIANGKCMVTNNFQSQKVLFKGQPIKRIEVSNVCKLMFAESDEFLSIRLIAEAPQKTVKTITTIGSEDLTEEDIKSLYGNDVNALTKIKLDKQKEDLESVRVGINKQVAFHINDLKNKISI